MYWSGAQLRRRHRDLPGTEPDGSRHTAGALMRDLKDIEQAFGDVAAEDEPVQRLLRPLLLRATQDPGLMRSLATHSLSQHLPFVGELLMDGQTLEPRALPRSPSSSGSRRASRTRKRRTTSRSGCPRRCVIVWQRSCARRSSRALHDGSGLSLLAVARLLALAFDDLPYRTHVLAGREVAAFPADAAASGAPSPVPPAPRAKPPARSKRRKESSGLLEAEAVLEPESAVARTARQEIRKRPPPLGEGLVPEPSFAPTTERASSCSAH